MDSAWGRGFRGAGLTRGSVVWEEESALEGLNTCTHTEGQPEGVLHMWSILHHHKLSMQERVKEEDQTGGACDRQTGGPGQNGRKRQRWAKLAHLLAGSSV